MILGVLEGHTEVTRAKIFGSRAKGNFKPNSDIDIALWGPLTFLNIARIAGELEELPLPYLFDVEAYENIHDQPLREHIDRAGKDFYVRG